MSTTARPPIAHGARLRERLSDAATRLRRLNPELVAESSRGGKKRLRTAIGVKIRAADAHAMNTDERFLCRHRLRHWRVRHKQVFWLLENYLFQSALQI